MSPELTRLRDELAKINGHETVQIRGILADLIKDKRDRKLLLYCVQEGILQEFLQKTVFDHFLIVTSKRKLIEDCLVDETNAELAISYCKFLSLKKVKIEIPNNLPDLIPYRKGDKWGYCDKNKKIVIPCRFEKAHRFWKEGYAKVEIKGQRSTVECIIDRNGRFIGCQYDYIYSFYDDESIYRIEHSKGFINKFGIIRTGTEHNLILRVPNVVDKNHDYNLFGEPHEGLTKIVTSQYAYGDKRNLFGFCDKNFLKITEKIYCEVGDFHEGLASVKLSDKWGFIDKTGNLIIPYSILR
jgi:hypothetical protein